MLSLTRNPRPTDSPLPGEEVNPEKMVIMMEPIITKPPKLKRDYKGRTVRLLRAVSNGYFTLPAGVIATIIGQGPKGSTLACETCSCCGIKARISGIHPEDIEFIEIGQRARIYEVLGPDATHEDVQRQFDIQGLQPPPLERLKRDANTTTNPE